VVGSQFGGSETKCGETVAEVCGEDRDDAGRPAARVREGVREVDCGLGLDQKAAQDGGRSLRNAIEWFLGNPLPEYGADQPPAYVGVGA